LMGMPDGVWAMSSIDDYRTFLQSAVGVRSTEAVIALTISYRATPVRSPPKGRAVLRPKWCANRPRESDLVCDKM
jgi:hypothetical protein